MSRLSTLLLTCTALSFIGCGPSEPPLADVGVDVADDAGSIDMRDDPSDVTIDAGTSSDVQEQTDVGTTVRPPDAALQELLPIEVIGAAPPAAAAVQIDVAAVPAGEQRLVMTIHNIVDDDSARVWVNDAGPFDLSKPESQGGFLQRRGATVSGTLNLPDGAVVEGTNVVTFEYTRQVRDVSGYRIIDLAIEVGDQEFRGPTTFDDPAGWAPYDDSPEALERGEQYFTEISRDGGPVCSVCHTDSGSDLEYYAFSNRSIVERAMFHEFPRAEAEDIASYLRSLDVPRDGRVWNPPFQPGPDNLGAAGAGLEAVANSDDAVGNAVFGASGLTGLLWDYAATIDTFEVPSAVQVPTWFRWLPRTIDDDWFTRQNGELAATRDALAEDPSMENAHAFKSAAVAIGKEILVENGDHPGRIALLRYAAVKLWDWSRKNDFYADHHGFPNDEYGEDGQWGSPAYPYEVGFAFFEAAPSGHPNAMVQAIEWWVVQMTVDPGRGRSNGNRPLDYKDVLLAAEAHVGPLELAWYYALGSWEESRGLMADSWGTPTGPVRMLEVVLPLLDAEQRTAVWLRHLDEEVAHGPVERTDVHHTLLSNAWSVSCEVLSDAQVAQIRARVPATLAADFEACQ